MNREQLNQMAAANAMREQEAFDKAIVNLIQENEMLKRQLNLMNINQKKEGKKNEGRTPPIDEGQKIKTSTPGRRKGGCLNMQRI